ncbi:hypothetical protein VP1G_03267 [Cytospora mali]|uniref:Cyclin-dependent kinase n=1 Tax=Cytospora mali TaxID=578113 RepID=A0A194UW60_CYTMA|nr:hypothetical protein VP1G_03267 [Valsa mali var. pyri (nom. inval.)]
MSSRPADDPPSQAGVVDNNNNNSLLPTANTILPRETISQECPSATGSYPLQKQSSSTSDSQATISSESNRVFTPPVVERTGSEGGAGSGQGSSQETQLLQLSQLAAAREKMPDLGPRSSVKRTADGTIKEPRPSPTASPHRVVGHSRNTSAVSAASTTSSRVTELSSELRARMSYALLKVNNGWESRTINEVENLASRAASPASSNSTVPGGGRSSASPRIRNSHRPPVTSHAASNPNQLSEGARRLSPAVSESHAMSAQLQDIHSLAPPVSIQPHRTDGHPRRNSSPKYTPNFLSPRSHHASPHTPSLATLSLSPDHRSLRAAGDAMVVSPTHNNREKDAMEALLFMSSPGNSANLKHHFPVSSQPLERLRNGASAASSGHRTALPTSAPKRKSLPNGRPAHSSQPLPAAHSPKKRVGFEKSRSTLSEMDIDDPSSPRRHAGYVRPVAPARRMNGTADRQAHDRLSVPLASVSGRPARPKPRIRSYEDLDAVLDRVAAEASSSDSEREIEIPGTSRRREGSAGMRA